MPVGLTLLILLSIFLLFRLGDSICESLHISRNVLLLFCGALIISAFVPPLMLISTMGINIAVLGVGIFFMFFLLFQTDGIKYIARTISAGLVTGALLFGLTYLVPPQPQGYIYQPYVLYGLVGGVLAFLFSRTTVGVAVTSIMGVLLLDLSIALLGIGSSYTYIVGSSAALSALVVALFTGCTPAVVFVYFKRKKTTLVRAPLRSRAKYNYEFSDDTQLRITTLKDKAAESKEDEREK